MNEHSPLTRYRERLSVCVLAAAIALTVSACTGTGTGGDRTGKTMIANPAAVNCIQQGGTLKILKRSDGGEYGICVFADGRLCEEWALFRGECPNGGVRVARDATPAAQFCAITGGSYRPTGEIGGPKEEGLCTFPGGTSCEAWAYFDGRCRPQR